MKRTTKQPTKAGYQFCCVCDTEKPLSSFKPHKIGNWGHYKRCEECRPKAKEQLPEGFCRCIKCKIVKELIAVNFQKVKRAKSGFDSRCKICIAEIRATYEPIDRTPYARQYYEKNKHKMFAKSNKKRKEDPKTRARFNAGRWPRQFIKEHNCNYSKSLGCTKVDLIRHLESQFYNGMTWDNYGGGPGKWQIDHIKSLALALAEGPESFTKACNYQNLQPLWHKDHVKKTTNDLKLIKLAKLANPSN